MLEYIDNLHTSTFILIFLIIYIVVDKLERYIKK